MILTQIVSENLQELEYKSLNIQLAEMSKERAREGLEGYNIAEDLIAEYFELADTCEMARYAPTSAEGKAEEVYSRSIRVIGKIEQNLR